MNLTTFMLCLSIMSTKSEALCQRNSRASISPLSVLDEAYATNAPSRG